MPIGIALNGFGCETVQGLKQLDILLIVKAILNP
jgi:hypothetical protein